MRWSRAVADGLIIGGKVAPVPGALVLGPGEADWLAIQARDGRKRTATEQLGVQLVTVHTTAGKDDHKIIGGHVSLEDAIERMKRVANYWRISARGSKQSGAAHLIIHDTFIAQLVDLLAFLTHGAGNNGINLRSVQIEMVQEDDGTILSSTLDTTVRACMVIADVIGIPAITTSRTYRRNTVHRRLRHGGADVVGFYGHRDNSWIEPQWYAARYTGAKLEQMRRAYPDGFSDRSAGDPGDEWYRRFRAAGAQAFDIDAGEDTKFVQRVQAALSQRFGERLKDDGVWGQKTTGAMRKHGLWNGGIVGPEFPVP
jgi:hypothetical protein